MLTHRQSPVLLNEGLLELLPVLPLSKRCYLAFYSACRTIGRSIIKSTIQTLVDYTPDDPSIDQEKLTNSINLAGLVQGANEVANALLRCFCTTTAQEFSQVFIEEVINSAELEGISNASCLVIQNLVTCLRDCNEVVCETATPLVEPSLTLFTECARKNTVDEENDMMNYIEKAISSRLRVLPVDLKPTVRDIFGSVLKLFAKDIGEEMRASICYDYQFQNIVANLSFIMTMAGNLVKEDADVLALIQEVLYTTYERCIEPALVDEQKLKQVVESGMEMYKEVITVELFYFCLFNYSIGKKFSTNTPSNKPHQIESI